MANYLVNYTPNQPGAFFVAGIGLASVNVEWEEKNARGAIVDSEEGSGGGPVFNIGIGYTFKGAFDVRAEIPVIVPFAPPGGAAAVVPTFIVTAGLRF